jgi:ubiquinone/menaquinone biosynthesis C-methylase UbiE
MNVSLGPILDEYARGTKLNIGSGSAIGTGWTNLDMNPDSGADVIHDLHNLPLPFGDETFDTVLASHVLEHIQREKTLSLVFDVARILKTGGRFIVAVPYATHAVAYACPLHTQLFDDHSFQYFTKACYSVPNSDGYHANQGYPVADWEIEKLAYVVGEDFLGSSDKELEFAKAHYLNVIREMLVVMRKTGN